MQTFIWNRAKRVADILYGVAAARGRIGYDPLSQCVGMQARHMSHLLGKVSRDSVKAGGPMWTALCVSRDTGMPKPQFYELARELRPEEYAGLPDEQLWRRERERCYAAARWNLALEAVP